MAKKVPAARVFEEWTERDLTAAALNGELPPAFEIDDQAIRRLRPEDKTSEASAI